MQWLFEYLPEEMRAQVPHHMATFLIVATICLAISVVVELNRKVEPVQVLGCVACTVVCVAFSLVIAVFSFFDPLQMVLESLDGLKTAFLVMGSDLLSIDVLGSLMALLNALTWVVALVFWGALAILPFPPILFAYSLESHAHGPLGGAIALVGHSAFVLPLFILAGMAYKVSMAVAAMVFAPILFVFCAIWFMGPKD